MRAHADDSASAEEPKKIVLKALSCPECTTLPSLISKLESSLKTHNDGLEKNKAYLASVAGDVSKAIKVKSNILIYVVRIETLKNNLQVALAQKSSKECLTCGGKK